MAKSEFFFILAFDSECQNEPECAFARLPLLLQLSDSF